jgi:hypothetical protein
MAMLTFREFALAAAIVLAFTAVVADRQILQAIFEALDSAW